MSFLVGASWLFLVWFLGWLSLPLARRIWGDEAKLPHAAFPDAGLAAGRMLLLVVWTLLALWCGHAGVPVRWCVFLILLPGALCVWLGIRDWSLLQATVRERRRGILASELVFLLVFAGFFIHRGFWPDFNNGEKPMDLALIGACARADYLPPPNPYAANVRLDSYYYLGHLQAALLTDAIHSTARWTYNLMCGTLPALCFSLAVSLCGAITRRVRNGVIGGCLLLATGTLEPLRQWFKPLPGVEAKTWPIDYMATSRVIPFTINEYPWFTFSYGDVHAHYFDMPVCLLVISLGWVLFWRIREGWDTSGWKWLAALCGVVLSANLMTNTWDFPTYTLFIFLCLAALVFFPGWKTTLRRSQHLAAAVADAPTPVIEEKPRTSKKKKSTASGVKSATQKQSRSKAQSKREVARPVASSHSPIFNSPLWSRLGMALGAMIGMAIISLLIGWPFLHHLHTAADKPRYLAQPASPPRSWLMMWALPMGAWIMHLAGATKRRLAAGQAASRIVTAAIVVPEALWLLLKVVTGQDYFVIIFLLTLTLWTAYEALFGEDVVHVWLCRLALCGFLALCWSETTFAGFLSDSEFRRQDTVFKFGLQAWFMVGTAALCSALRVQRADEPALEDNPQQDLPAIIEPGPGGEDSSWCSAWSRWPIFIRLAYYILLPVAFTSTVSTTWARMHHTSDTSHMDNVDMNAPLRFQGWDVWSNLGDAERDAAQWLQDHARDGDNLIEAEMREGGDYSVYPRYAHATGVPTVVGPQSHTFQWGLDWPDVFARKEAVRAFYTANQTAVLQKYKVRYIVCGELERREYTDESVANIERSLAANKLFGSGVSADPQHLTTIYQNPH